MTQMTLQPLQKPTMCRYFLSRLSEVHLKVMFEYWLLGYVYLSFQAPTKSSPADAAEFLSAMTCLSVSVDDRGPRKVLYHCRMEDGKLQGMLDLCTWLVASLVRLLATLHAALVSVAILSMAKQC